jgi:VanZ family protein
VRLPHIAVWNADKVAHFGLYMVLAFLVHRYLRAQRRFPLLRSRPYFFTVLLTALYGLSDELHQAFVPGRNPSLADLLADTGGAALFCIIFFVWVRRGERRAAKRRQREARP